MFVCMYVLLYVCVGFGFVNTAHLPVLLLPSEIPRLVKLDTFSQPVHLKPL